MQQEREDLWDIAHLTKLSWNRKDLCAGQQFLCLKAIDELKKCGVFVHALIKKRSYWLKYIPGEKIIADFTGKEVGLADAMKAKLDGVPF